MLFSKLQPLAEAPLRTPLYFQWRQVMGESARLTEDGISPSQERSLGLDGNDSKKDAATAFQSFRK